MIQCNSMAMPADEEKSALYSLSAQNSPLFGNFSNDLLG